MEEFNYFADDFLSNGGFHQLYSASEHPEEIFLWDSRVSGLNENSDSFDTSNSLDYGFNFNHSFQSERIFANDYLEQSGIESGVATYSPEHQYYDFDQNTYENVQNTYENDQKYNIEIEQRYEIGQKSYGDFIVYNPISETDFDQWNVSPSDNYQLESDWELNLENLLLDNQSDASSSAVSDLPDRTLFCNDSCNIFLKESSENLNSNLQTFLPHDNGRPEPHSNAIKRPISSNKSKAPSISPNADDEKIFTCTFGDCKKVYAKAGHLKAHLRRHVGEKPYVCHWPNCTWKFSRSDELSRHRRSHSGIKPYKCDYCPKCFSRSDHLTKHRKVHERKMAALKIKAVWTSLPQGRPGRRPKALMTQSN